MFTNKSILILVALLSPMLAHGQQSEPGTPLRIRAVFHDPVHPAAELYLGDPSGSFVKLDLVPEALSAPQNTIAVNGSLVLYNTASVDPKSPQASVAATIKIPANTKQVIVVVLPGPPESKPPYRMVLIEDSKTAFPKGESRALSLVPVETAIEAGEHKLPVNPGKITRIPPVKKLDDFNMAQTNFYYKNDPSWVVFSERQLQYLDEFRRIFIIHVTPGSKQPFVSTIVDTEVAELPR